MQPNTSEQAPMCAAQGCRARCKGHALFCDRHERIVPGAILSMLAAEPNHTTWRARAIDHIAGIEQAMAAPRDGKKPLWAITVHQPWASLIACGEKNVENRTWHPPATLLGHWFAIHAGKGFELDSWRAGVAAANAARVQTDWVNKATGWFERARGMTERAGKTAIKQSLTAAVPYGAIVALARVARVIDAAEVTPETAPWFLGPLGWVLEGVTPIEPEPCGGQQGLWAVTGEPLLNVRRKFRSAIDQFSDR